MSTTKKIITLPHSSLRKKSKAVEKVSDKTLELVEDMKRLTLEWEDSREHEVGVALAAVQIDTLDRVVIIRHDFDDKENREFDVYINPEIAKQEGDLVEDFEGCLSIKDVYGKVPRYSKVRVKAKGVDGQPISKTAKGFLARVFQHEIDHTNGVMFIDHIQHNPDSFFRLEKDGHLTKLDYQKDIKDNKDLWDD